MNTVISFFVALGFAIAFANGTPVSDDCDREIKERVDSVICVVEDRQKTKNCGQSLVVSTINDLKIYLKVMTTPLLLTPAMTLSVSEAGIAGALDGASDGLKHGNLVDALFGILGGSAGGLTTGFQRAATDLASNVYQGSDPKENARIKECLNVASQFAVYKRDEKNCGLSEKDAALNKVYALFEIYLRFVIGFIVLYASKPILSAVCGLTGGLTNGLSQHDLFRAAIDAGRGACDGLAEGAISGFGDFIIYLLTLSH